jgi:hypothetical protein
MVSLSFGGEVFALPSDVDKGLFCALVSVWVPESFQGSHD